MNAYHAGKLIVYLDGTRGIIKSWSFRIAVDRGPVIQGGFYTWKDGARRAAIRWAERFNIFWREE